ncbi:hypothetical protein KCU88_g7054, partial [Aureobasidium melanogenum]
MGWFWRCQGRSSEKRSHGVERNPATLPETRRSPLRLGDCAAHYVRTNPDGSQCYESDRTYVLVAGAAEECGWPSPFNLRKFQFLARRWLVTVGSEEDDLEEDDLEEDDLEEDDLEEDDLEEDDLEEDDLEEDD